MLHFSSVYVTAIILASFVCSEHLIQVSGYGISPSNVPSTTCGGAIDLDTKEVELKSPGFDTEEEYDNNLLCKWNVTSPEESKIRVSIQSLSIELTNDCQSDYLVLDAVRGKKRCGTENKNFFISEDRKMEIIFKTDSSYGDKGFNVTLKTVYPGRCDWTHDASSSTFSSPKFNSNYHPDMNCNFTLKSLDTNKRILIVFQSLDLEPDYDCETCCDYDHLMIYDKPSIGSWNMKDEAWNLPDVYADSQNTLIESKQKICGSFNQTTFLSSGNEVTIQLVSDASAEYEGFTAKYYYIDQKKDDTIIIPTMTTTTERPSSKEDDGSIYPEDVAVNLGSSYILTCKPFKKVHRKRVKWKKGQRMLWQNLFEESTRLMIPEFSFADMGLYRCIYGDKHWDARLTVANSSCNMFFLKKLKTSMSFMESQSTILGIKVINSFQYKVDITWYKDGQLIENGPNHLLLPSGHLLLPSLKPSDTGFYVVKVQSTEDSECSRTSVSYIKVNQIVKVSEVCGNPRLNPNQPVANSRVVGGEPAAHGMYPWMAIVANRCGGSILNEKWIITAAHCFDTLEENWPQYILLGKHDLSEDEEETRSKNDIEEFVIHPEYDPVTYNNDISLIKVKQTIQFTEYIRPLCLFPDKDMVESIYPFNKTDFIQKGTVTGWGLLKEDGDHPAILHKVDVPLVTTKKCFNSTSRFISQNMFCAGTGIEGGGDACKGDSGGPLSVQRNGRSYLLGIVSWGEGCARRGKYGVYTKVSNYLEWILSRISHF